MRLARCALAIEQIAGGVEAMQNDAELLDQLDVRWAERKRLRADAPGFLRKESLCGKVVPHIMGAFERCHEERLTWHSFLHVQKGNKLNGVARRTDGSCPNLAFA